MNVTAQTSLRDAACEYASLGWSLLPLRPRDKAPIGQLVPHGIADSSSDLATVFRWWSKVPNANIGINCRESGLVVVDMDPRNGGVGSLVRASVEIGTLPVTREVFTGGQGSHWYFRHPGVSLRSPGPGIDMKDRGYVLAPPSVHPSGGVYKWAVHDPLASLPSTWTNELAQAERPAVELKADTSDPLRRVPAHVYVSVLAGRDVDEHGFCPCPIHNDHDPSLKVDGTLWACYGCKPILGKQVMGGNIYDFAAALWGFPMPLRGADFAEVQDRLKRELSVEWIAGTWREL